MGVAFATSTTILYRGYCVSRVRYKTAKNYYDFNRRINAKSIASVIDLIVSAIASTHLGVSAFRVYLLKLMPTAGKKALFLVRSVLFLIGDKPYLLSHG